MSRPSTLHNVVLLAVVCIQAWMLHRPSADDPASHHRADARSSSPTSSAAIDARAHDPLAMAVMDRLERIDARLAALESARSPETAVADASGRPDPRDFADADRRLAALLPDRELDAEDWTRWQATLAALPPSEQSAVAAAFARAVNQDRIRLRF